MNSASIEARGKVLAVDPGAQCWEIRAKDGDCWNVWFGPKFDYRRGGRANTQDQAWLNAADALQRLEREVAALTEEEQAVRKRVRVAWRHAVIFAAAMPGGPWAILVANGPAKGRILGGGSTEHEAWLNADSHLAADTDDEAEMMAERTRRGRIAMAEAGEL